MRTVYWPCTGSQRGEYVSATKKLLDKWLEVRPKATDTAHAEHLGATKQAFANWKNGHRHPSAEFVAQMAEEIGEDPVAWVLAVDAERGLTAADTKVRMRLAKGLGWAAAITLALIGQVTSAKASTRFDNNLTPYTFTSLARLARGLLRRWRRPGGLVTARA